jgi:hypothetical protein
MITTGEYWKLADHVHYHDPASGVHPAPGMFTCDRAELSASFFGTKTNRNGFHAAVYTKGGTGERVLAIAGTQGMAFNDILADVRLMCGVMPRQASSALKFFNSAINANDVVVIVGHSLGGGLAQVLGYWCNRPFVTFNAPGMSQVLGAARHNLFKPDVRRRSRDARQAWEGPNGSRGLNFRIAHDAVGKFGKHLGDVIVLNHNPAAFTSHASLKPALKHYLVQGKRLYDLDPFAVF